MRKAKLTVDVISTVGALERLRPEYEHLYEITLNQSPFALLDWHVAWCLNFLNVDPKIKDRLLVMVLRDADQVCVGIVPLVASRRRVGFLNIVSIAMLGIDPSTTELRAPLIAPSYEAAAISAIHSRLAQEVDWDWISWGDIDIPLEEAFAMNKHVSTQAGPPGYMLDLAPTWELFHAGLKRNIRESLRHCYNSLKRDGLTFQFNVIMRPSEVPRATERFLELHQMRALQPGTTEHPNHFLSTTSRRFLSDVCMRLAENGTLRIFQLHIDAQVVASRIGFELGDCLFLYYSGFDPKWSRYSVMTTTVCEALKFAILRGIKTVNLSRGTDASKTRWGPRRVEYQSAIERRSGLFSRIATYTYLNARTSKGFPNWVLKRLLGAPRDWN